MPLAFGLGAGGKGLSGILFRPSVHYGDIGPYAPSRGERLRDLRKAILYRAMLRNPALERVLSLDPFFPAMRAAHYRGGEKVAALPDPAHPRLEQRTNHVPAAFPAGSHRFPAVRLSRRAQGSAGRARRAAPTARPRSQRASPFCSRAGSILPCGPALEQRRAALAREQPGLWLRIDDRRLDSDELAALVRQSDVVLAPYQRFVGSSGVLLWAALNGRPVLAQNYGLVGRLTREHQLGLSVDACAPAEIAREIGAHGERRTAHFFDRRGRRTLRRGADSEPLRLACAFGVTKRQAFV